MGRAGRGVLSVGGVARLREAFRDRPAEPGPGAYSADLVNTTPVLAYLRPSATTVHKEESVSDV